MSVLRQVVTAEVINNVKLTKMPACSKVQRAQLLAAGFEARI